jgi:hypothetical protein
MRRVVSQVAEKRLFLAFADETHRVIGQHIGDEALRQLVLRAAQQLQTLIAAGRSTPGEKQVNDAEIVVMKNNRAKAAKE